MYKRELCESSEELIEFLNKNRIDEKSIIAILPFEASNRSGEAQLKREYELIYKERSKSCQI